MAKKWGTKISTKNGCIMYEAPFDTWYYSEKLAKIMRKPLSEYK